VSLLASSRQTSRSTFERWASFYDNSRIIKFFLRGWDERVIKLNPPAPILDLGCATGRLAGKLIRNGVESITGLDLSHNCLSIARKNAGDYQFYPAQGFIEDLPFKDATFASVMFSGVIHHLEKPLEALKEAARVLKPSGKLFIIEPYFVMGIRQIVNLTLDIYPIHGDRRFYTPGKIIDMAQNSGFAKKDVFQYPLFYILIFERC
jgi:ubiquinone/menaquinone biosynthesis C-methylase UbiE